MWVFLCYCKVLSSELKRADPTEDVRESLGKSFPAHLVKLEQIIDTFFTSPKWTPEEGLSTIEN